MKYIKFCFMASCLLLASVSCKSEYELLLEGNDVDVKYAAAFDYFNQSKYTKAAQLFESISALATGTEREDTVLYYWGLSNYRFKDYYTAETNFTSFLYKFPMSPFAETARYLRIDCLYRMTYRYELDQKPSINAITAIQQYLTDYPQTPYLAVCMVMLDDLEERLDRKALEAAKLYYKMEDYKAAEVAFKNVLKDDSENRYREDILYYSAMASYKYADMSVPGKQKERFLLFVDNYLNFVGEYPDSHYRKELDGNYRRAQKFLGRNVAVTSSEEDEEQNS